MLTLDSIRKNAEWSVVITCLRQPSDNAEADRCRELLHSGVDWEALFEFANLHDLLPMLFWGLDRMFAAYVPSATMELLSDHFQANHLRNRLAADVFQTCHNILRSENIPHIVFKGFALSSTVYEHPALRQFGDIDLLLHPDHLDRACHLCEDIGYSRIYPQFMLRNPLIQQLSPKQLIVYENYYHEFTLQSRDELMPLDLHWRWSPRMYPSDPDLSTVWNEATPLSFGGVSALTLSAEHQLLNVCIHAARDRWKQLKWVVDIDRILRSTGAFDWERLQHFAKASRAERILRIGIQVAHHLIETPIPPEAPKYVRKKARQRDLAPVLSALFLPEKQPSRTLRCLGINEVYFRIHGMSLHQIQYFLQALIMPRPADEVTFNVPWIDQPLWKLYRPVRVVKSCIRRMHISRNNGETQKD
ncbi:nucleotidyltransferase domain-containing protein [Thiocapsa marina]|uniref:Nucleotidyltransferase family protein n=1 Tax=Thiocapsa marina 5811 TaxID=768671 RepID=F9UAT1_9GAMM|nr:nucleotidyltransferase family protein [Thiocapsa marina]EGV18549.1 hypothetical protein ThimaDRAFT_1967 [Thiocapsa marina 5811]